MYNTASAEQQSDALTAAQSVCTYRLTKSKEEACIRAVTSHRNMVKQRICGIILALCGCVPIVIDKDVTAFVFLTMFYLPMIFGKQYIMTFAE